jgi:hypothetical protein
MAWFGGGMKEEKRTPIKAITSLYLTIPVLLFAVGWLRTPFAVATVALVALIAVVAIRDTYQAIQAGGLLSNKGTNRSLAVKSVIA